MIVPAGETHAAPTVLTLDAPHQRLLFPQPSDAVFVPQIDVFFNPLPRRRPRHQIEHLRAIFGEADVVIKLIQRLHARRHSTRHRMIWQPLQIRHPMRIHRPARLKRPADPRAEIFRAVRCRRMHRVVHKHKPHALLRQRVHLCPALAYHLRRVGVNDDGFCRIEERLIRRPALHHARANLQPALLRQRLREQ